MNEGNQFVGYFTFDLKKVVIVILMVVIPLVSINLQKDRAETPWFLVPFTMVGHVLENTYAVFSTGIRSTTSMYLNLINIKKSNQALLKENTEFRTELGALTELKLENERLNKMLEFQQKTNMKLMAAKVVGIDPMPNHNSITIDRGTSDGIQRNMAAITSGGAVGYVINVQYNSSQVLLLTDRYAAIDSIVQRSRARGIVEGKTRESCKLSYLQRSDDVQEGDLVVTSGLDNIFPKGFPVGTVTMVKKTQYGMSQTVDIQPAINPFTLEEIFVITDARHQDYLNDTDEKQLREQLSGDALMRSWKE